MDMSKRTPLAWLRSQRAEARRPWQGQGPVAEPAQKAQATAPAAAPRKPAAAPADVIVKTLLG